MYVLKLVHVQFLKAHLKDDAKTDKLVLRHVQTSTQRVRLTGRH